MSTIKNVSGVTGNSIAITPLAAILLSTSLSSDVVAQAFADVPGVTPMLETIVVTASGSANTLGDTAASIGVISDAEIEAVNPTHAAELMNRIPGVNIVQLGSSGSGVMAAIRQPMSTSPVYLYLENGVPTRAAGFFNHNALYEVNLSGANGVEIIKGPGSALYGSDAIGAVVNTLSGRPPKADKLSVNVEGAKTATSVCKLRALNSPLIMVLRVVSLLLTTMAGANKPLVKAPLLPVRGILISAITGALTRYLPVLFLISSRVVAA